MQRLAIFVAAILATAFSQSPTQFRATFVEYNNPLVTGTMNGTINYDAQGLFIRNDYTVAGGFVNEYFDFNKKLRYLFCGTCDAQTWTTPIPVYHSDGLVATGAQMALNGQTCSEFTVGGGNPVASIWTAASGLPCRAVYTTGMVVDFTNFLPLDGNSFAIVPSWNCPPQQCNRLMDVVLIFDESGSIQPADFVREVQFGASLASNFVFGPNAVGMALIQFSGAARFSIHMTFIQQSFINSMNAVVQLGGATCIGCGLQLAVQELNQNGRTNVARLFIMLTDGMNNVGVADFPNILQSVKAANILIFAIGVGPFTNAAEINSIASNANTAFPLIPSFTALQGVVNNLVAATCTAIPGTPCGPTCHGFCSCKGTCICPSSCDDGNACTVDSCTVGVQGSGCTHTPLACTDGNLCTQDLCLPASGCYFPPVTCTAPDVCHTASCNPALGCQFPPVQCISNSPCYSSTCVVAQGGCVNTTLPCNHCLTPQVVTCPHINCFTNVCNGSNGLCQATPKNCDDGNVCTMDYCDPNTDQCYHNLTVCDDGSKCTHKSCDPFLGCKFTPFNTTDCDDHNVCTIDSCNPLVGCVHTNISCASNNTCIVDTCDPFLGCLHAPFDCLTIPRIAKFIGTCYSAYCNASGKGCMLQQLPGTIIDTCGVCNGNNGCKNLVQLPSNVPLAIAGGSLAAIVVGAAILFVALAAFGGKKGYDIWLAHRNNMSGASSNPLYHDNGMTGRNPMYSSRVTRI